MEATAEKCCSTSLKDLVSELTSRELQDKFDRRAEKELEKLAGMVRNRLLGSMETVAKFYRALPHTEH